MGLPTRDGKLHEPYVIGGNVTESVTKWSGPASYTTGGVSISAKDLGLTYIMHMVITCIDGTRMAFPVFASADKQASILMLISSIAGVEVANASDQSAKKFIIRACGIT